MSRKGTHSDVGQGRSRNSNYGRKVGRREESSFAGACGQKKGCPHYVVSPVAIILKKHGFSLKGMNHNLANLYSQGSDIE